MKKLEYIDESTFITEEIEFSDEHYELAENLYKNFKDVSHSPIMVKNDKKSLVFCLNLFDKSKDRVDTECGNNVYRVIIEKI
jgi:hypothetical protein